MEYSKEVTFVGITISFNVRYAGFIAYGIKVIWEENPFERVTVIPSLVVL